MSARLTAEELVAIRARHEQGEVIFDERHVVHADRGKLLSELEWVTAERDAWRTRCHRITEALDKGWEKVEAGQ